VSATGSGARDVGTWELVRPAVIGLLAVVLLALGAAILSGQATLWRQTVADRDAQDFGIFLASARHFLSGRSLYTRPTANTWRRGSGPLNLNLPHTNLLFLPFALLSTGAALTTWLLTSGVLFVWSSWCSLRALRWRMPAVVWMALAVYLLTWGPAAALSLTAQLSFFVAAPVTCAWLAARRGRHAHAGAWLGLAAALKPFLLLFVPFFVLRRDAAALKAFALTCGGVVVAGLIVFGPHSYYEWLAQLPRITWSSHYMNASIGGLAERLFGRYSRIGIGWHPRLLLLLLIPSALLVVVETVRRAARASVDAAGTDRAWAALLVASLLASPLGWAYYMWIAVWPLAATVGHARPWHRRRAADLLLIPGLACWVWFARMATWAQPSLVATLTFASMYFWALLSLWLWTVHEVGGDATRPAEATAPSLDTGAVQADT
jgi:hypothetical protein